jgi:putative ABC transport system permease protein
MRTLREWILRLVGLFNKQRRDWELDEEIESHLQMHIEDNLRSGMTPEEARRQAVIKLGGIEATKEAYRDQRGLPWLEILWQDVRFGARMLYKNPGFTAVAVLTLALGIGANTAIFSIVKGVLLRPLPYREPGRLVTVSESNLRRGIQQVVVTPANLQDWREQNSVFEELGGQIYTSLTLTGRERPEHLHAVWTTPNYFSIFGVPPILGRTFIAGDKPPKGHRVVVLSYGFWQSRFAGDRNVLGQSITLSGLNYTVVGVMPEQFKVFHPAKVFGLPTGRVDPQIWAPYPGSMSETTNHFFLVFGRLKSGIALDRAQAEITAIAARAGERDSARSDWGACVQSLKEQVVGGTRPALRLLLAAVGFVLLIACANVANLALTRNAAREREFAIRTVLGAARSRLLRQLLVESTIVSVLGGSLGLLLARCSLACLKVLQPADFPRVDEIRLDGSVLIFTLSLSLLTGLLFGVAPALLASKPEVNESLMECGRSATEGRLRRRSRKVLVVAEVALAMILLAGAALILNGFTRLIRVGPGFEPARLMAFDFSPARPRYAEDSERMRLVKHLREGIEPLPGVESAATIYGLPFGTMLNSLVGVSIEGRSRSDSRERVSAGWRVVSASYFKTMGIALAAGRLFSDELDTPNSAKTVIINESFAHKYFGGENPLGHRVQPLTISTNWHEIVGVIKDVKLTGLDAAPMPEMYQCDSQNAVWMFSLVVRSSMPERQIENMVRAQVAAVDNDLPVFNVRTMQRAVNSSFAQRRFTLMLVGLFASLALILTAVGIYGVVSYSVMRQTREIGIRMALGASCRSVLGLTLREGMGAVLIGMVLGLAGSLGLTRLIANQLFGVSPTDPATLGSVSVFLMAVALTACYLPARRAARVDPMAALRYE